MSTERGTLSIHSENIFPIIKKWLYSDHDIFVRELVSNGCDAITKLKKLEIMGEATLPEDNHFQITVTVNPEEKTICFSDNGIGMTAEEVKEYINQIAFSGAQKFMEKYKDKTNEDQIIGHFGLGFYSAFMVAGRVSIDTLSWQEGAEPVHWESDGGTEYEMSTGTRTERGTDITLYLNEESYEFSNEYRVREIIKKYCSFMPVEIYFVNANAPKEEEKEEVIDASVNEEGVASEDSAEKEEKKEKKKPEPINNTNPLWMKHPNDCTEEEYKNFYHDVFHDYKEPLFWIHLNMDYPFNLKGILYFPKINTEYDSLEGLIKLYSNQVFIADNIKEVIPEFLMLLKGVIDCPDLPLNVSRSALQNDGFVKKISDYITKKVADKLTGMFKVERENYEKFWDDISPFIKFGCLKDDKFREKVKDVIIFKNLEGKYLTLADYIAAKNGTKDTEKDTAKEAEKTDSESEKNSNSETDKGTESSESKEEHVHDEHCECGHDHDHDEEVTEDKKTIVYYVTDEKQQSQYINMFKEAGLDAFILTHNIDQPFITQLEYQDQTIKFQRIDADISDSFKEETKKKDQKVLKNNTEAMTKLFRKVLGKEKLEVKVEKLKNDKVSSVMTLSEESRRMQDMMRMYSMQDMDPNMFGGGETLILNANNQLVQYIITNENSEYTPMICEQLYDLALLSHKPLDPEAMTKFIQRSNEIMLHLAK
ncbi:molecular chaperone HtpG [Lachnospiraceae bacterium MD1]|uniref:Molecular chaperone HtpG n=1 Tax=Variimorphobacter saccharofermentans TaxID=2755051 RepID=A0A839JYH4_9FIRM|nr:molecular chaperone HtpG [Variimorphobacter saccharofermentans]MBB2182278.1 molecular chaperone HtpG [Variimorphobacter saccharofermentans]